MCRLRLALLFCCDCLLLLVFIFTWHPLKQKIPDEQVPKGLLSRDCERSFQFIPKEKLLWTGVWWRVLEKSSLDCSGDDDGWNIFWTTVEMEYLYLDIVDDIANIFSSLPKSYAWSPRSEMWPVMFFISYFGNPKDFNLQKVVFPAGCFFLFAHSAANGDFFFNLLNIVFIVLIPMARFLYQISVRGASITAR